ncbi:MAG: hypothetical protein H7255_20555 [Ramlibacter sp.]|nr:hypothetical protein [Ramlibacter sp.]
MLDLTVFIAREGSDLVTDSRAVAFKRRNYLTEAVGECERNQTLTLGMLGVLCADLVSRARSLGLEE